MKKHSKIDTGMNTAMFLFDTDSITNILKPSPSIRLLDKLNSVPQREQFISTITLSEIVYGAYRSNKKDFHLKKLQQVLLPAVQMISFDSKAAFVCGALKAELESKGKPLSLADLQIASIAVANDLVLISGNIKHFTRVPGLTVENWI